MNKALKLFERFIDQKDLETEVFTEKPSLHEFPKGFKPTSVMTVKQGPKVLFVFACNRSQFWIDVVDETDETMEYVKALEKIMKDNGIVQVR